MDGGEVDRSKYDVVRSDEGGSNGSRAKSEASVSDSTLGPARQPNPAVASVVTLFRGRNPDARRRRLNGFPRGEAWIEA